MDVKGKWVLIMVNDPPAPADEPNLFGGKALTYYGRWTYKFEEAARQGAAGALLIHTDESATYPWQVVQSSWTGTQYSLPPAPGAPALGVKAWIANAAAVDLVKRGGQDLDALRAKASNRGFSAQPLTVTASATLTQRAARKTSPNVIGVLKGTNEKEAVAISAHWDHFGTRAPAPTDAPDADRINNGAYDNASGCAVGADHRAGHGARRQQARHARSTSCSRRPRSRACSAASTSPRIRRCRWRSLPPTSTSTAPTTWARPRTS